jgi:DDE_Tnp_1-associated
MSKRSRRPNREAIKKQREERKQAQHELRQRQQAEGFTLPPSSSLPNRTSSYNNVEEERAARTELVGEQVKVFRAMLPILLKRLSKIDDPRNPKKNKHKLTVLLIYGILCFAFQMSSRREANREMTRPMFEENLRGLFPDLEELPHADTLARLLARIEVSEIEQAHLDMIHHLIRNKKFRKYLIRGCYPVAVDGTQKLSRAVLWAAECLERKIRSKKDKDQENKPNTGKPTEQESAKEYYVYVLEANLAFANGMVIPLLSEVLSAQQGDSQRDKQDCEQRAFHRLAQRLKKCFSHLPMLLLLDGLYPNGPIIELCRQNNWDFMMVLQDDSLPTVWEEFEGLKRYQSQNRLDRKWGDRQQQFFWVNDIGYSYKDPATGKTKTQKVHVVVCKESWEEIAPDSTQVVQKKSKHAWLSDQPLHRGNVHERCNLGARHRWGIESGILVEKHHGYQYEHCFSYDWEAMRGYHYLMRLGHALNVLARYSCALTKYIRALGVRGLIDLVRATIAAPWLQAEDIQRIATATCQLRLE